MGPASLLVGGTFSRLANFTNVAYSRRKFLIGLVAGMAWAGCGKPKVDRPTAAGSTPSPELSAVVGGKPSTPTVAWNGQGNLRDYYVHGKYLQEEIDAVADMIGQLFKEREVGQQRQMVAEILSFHHVIFHPTEYHDLRKNHKAIRKHKDLLEKLCARHGIPFLPVLAITSWENSGGADKVSWADAAGLGQMTWGAVDEAHRYAARKAQELKEEAQWEAYHGKSMKDQAKLDRAEALKKQAGLLNVEQRHRQMAKQAGVKDERAIPECNLEDVVLFFAYLMSQYGGRVDHAIGAYHKGVLNQDDIVYDYLRRRDPTVLYPQAGDRSSFLEALQRLDVSYLDLWNDSRSREMLNGLRTVEGEKTTPANAALALGDESDVYPWKVLGSLSALLAGEEYLNRAVERYSVPQLAGEVRGLPAFAGEQGRREGADSGYLIKFPEQYWSGDHQDKRQAWVRPELAGYLLHLRDRMSRATGNAWKLPLVALGKEPKERAAWTQELYSKGVAARITTAGMDIETRGHLKELLNQDYLFDRVYLNSGRDEYEFVVNPRFGHEFMKLYESKIGVSRAED